MDNDDISPTPKGFTKYVEKTDFLSEMGKIDTRFNKMEVTFHGADGASGLIAEVNTIKTKLEIAEGLIRFLTGTNLLQFLIAVATLLKLFNII